MLKPGARSVGTGHLQSLKKGLTCVQDTLEAEVREQRFGVAFAFCDFLV